MEIISFIHIQIKSVGAATNAKKISSEDSRQILLAAQSLPKSIFKIN